MIVVRVEDLSLLLQKRGTLRRFQQTIDEEYFDAKNFYLGRDEQIFHFREVRSFVTFLTDINAEPLTFKRNL